MQASKLGVIVDSSQIYEYLCKICNPTNYTGKTEDFQIANNLYERVLGANMDYEMLEDIMEDAHVAKFGILEEEPIVIEEPFSKIKVIAILSFVFWEIIHFVLWGTDGTLNISTLYFFPFQTTNLAKYDHTEFLVYGVIVPIVIFCVFNSFKMLNKSSNIKNEK